ncbi:ATP-binding cassette domain-containing protein [Isoptericola halotolerans]|uniref:ATP-binding cassette domain-containing protein n=1 Tax=Isoptericola halotolerans TaxID=300560 RepID=UPI003890F117
MPRPPRCARARSPRSATSRASSTEPSADRDLAPCPPVRREAPPIHRRDHGMSDVPIIELQDVRKSFGPVSVLQGIDFRAYPGKVTALVGDNGAGKSTLIKGLAGVQPYDSGTVLFDGRRVELQGPRDAARLGIEVPTRTSRCATTSTSCRTCSSAARRCPTAPSTRGSWRRRPRTPCGPCRSAP